jgi:preprotein translocase subunit YajC
VTWSARHPCRTLREQIEDRAGPGAITEEQPTMSSLILIYVVAFGALMLWTMSRNRKKQSSQAQMMQQALVIGAEVRTIGGLIGTVIELTDEYVIIETTPGVKLKFTKQAIAGVVHPEVAEPAAYGDELTPAEQDAVEAEEAETDEAEEAETESATEDAKDQQKVG